MAANLIARAPLKVVRVIGSNLFRIALDELNDALQWERIADLNSITDPFLTGYHELLIPAPLPSPTNGGALGIFS
jgi:hypothetical protein